MNKSAYKLKGFGPLYIINLDDQPERMEWMANQLEEWEIKDYTRISAYDGRPSTGNDLSDIIKGKYPESMSPGEIGCVTSHLKALKHFVEETDEPYAIIMEDDCDISIAQFWTFTWRQFISRMPYDWDTVQLAVICPGELHVQVHRRFINDFSTACYVITRHHAQKLIKLHVRGSQYKLDNGVKPRPVADDLIYNSGAPTLVLYYYTKLSWVLLYMKNILKSSTEVVMMDSENCGQLVEATLPLTCYQILIPIWGGLQANIHRNKGQRA